MWTRLIEAISDLLGHEALRQNEKVQAVLERRCTEVCPSASQGRFQNGTASMNVARRDLIFEMKDHGCYSYERSGASVGVQYVQGKDVPPKDAQLRHRRRSPELRPRKRRRCCQEMN